jgi:hypothetical protein
MKREHETCSERVKFVYNAQFPAPTATLIKYLVHNPSFTSRYGRQLGMDAMMAFYRPLAEEFHGELSVSEIQEMARHCVERLVKQIDDLCNRYRIANPTTRVTTSSIGDFGPLERVLEQGFLRMAESFQSGVIVSTPSVAVPNFEQGVEMDGSELGDLGGILDG